MNLIECNFPLIKTALTRLRDEKSDHEIFRLHVKLISKLLAAELSKKFELREHVVSTPLEDTTGYKLRDEIILLPILRAGLGMLEGFLEVIPQAKSGHIGLQRNEETLLPENYYYKIPKSDSPVYIVLDPMLATGGSASEAIRKIKKEGVKQIFLVSVISAPEGVKKINADHPDITVYTACLDRELNEKGYILPGLGDAGDRIFGT